MSETVVVLGASNKPERYSYKAISMLLEHSHNVIPVHPALDTIQGLAVLPSLNKVDQHVDTVTVYLNPTRVEQITSEIIKLAPSRVIFNPGTESSSAMSMITEAGIEVVQACTLVLLRTGQF